MMLATTRTISETKFVAADSLTCPRARRAGSSGVVAVRVKARSAIGTAYPASSGVLKCLARAKRARYTPNAPSAPNTVTEARDCVR